jgi:hypothetical protein
LWFDEVWSWEFARSAQTPAQLFFGAQHHHDNNHKLNTLYLYFVPDGEPFWAYRLHSLAAGLAAVLLAYRAAVRRGKLDGLLAALFVAVSSWFVLSSAEARGYALLLAFALAAFDGLQRYLRDGGLGYLLQFWLAVILGFLAHLTFLHAYLAFGVWTVYHFARNRETKGSELLQLARVHAVPATFFVLLYLLDVRRMEIGGAPPTWLPEILGSLLCRGVGLPYTPLLAILVAGLALSVFAAGLQLLRRQADDSWVFFAMAIVGSPLLLLLMRPPFVYERYFFLPLLFFLLLLGYVLADLARRFRAGIVLSLAVAAAMLLGNVALLSEFVHGGGRGEFVQALRHIDAHADAGPVTVAGDLDLRVSKMMRFYGPPRFEYIPQTDAPAHPADWLLIHRPDRDQPPLDEFAFPPQGGVLYRRDSEFRVGSPAGWDWYVYHRVGVAP